MTKFTKKHVVALMKKHVIALMNETAEAQTFVDKTNAIYNLAYLMDEPVDPTHLDIKVCKGCVRSAVGPFHHATEMVDEDLCRDCDKHMGEGTDDSWREFYQPAGD